MNKISFEDIGSVVVTLNADETVKKGQAVGITGRETVGIPSADGPVCGVAVDVSPDGMASVQVRGFATVRYSGSVTPGWISLTSNGSGGVQKAGAGAAGHEVLLVSTDPARRTAVVLL